MPEAGAALYPILDVEAAAGRDLAAVARGWAALGIPVQQLRAKKLGGRDFLALATTLAGAAPGLVVNDRVDVARLSGAAGVHLGQDDLPLEAVGELLPAGALVGISTHNQDQIERVTAGGRLPSYLAVGPVFATSSKSQPDPVVGLEGVRAARRLWTGKLVAIGGIELGNCRAVWEAGADAVAVISGLWKADDPVAAAREFLLAFEQVSCHSPEE